MPKIIPLGWEEVKEQVTELWDRHADNPPNYIYGVPTNGCFVALLLQEEAEKDGHKLTVLDKLPEQLNHNITNTSFLVVDDLVDSGKTFERYPEWKRDALYRKPHSPGHLAPDATLVDGWITFPWEKDDGDPTDAVVRIIEHIGENPTREGLLDTPRRVIKAFTEMTVGYDADIEKILGVQFDVGEVSGTVLLSGIPFTSLCEHHMLPFTGTATVGYVPGDKVVGLSKLARLVDAHSRRLQVQERLTEDIATDLYKHLKPEGVGVVIHAHHQCMSCRGVQKPNATMTTNTLRGVIAEDPTTRQEFMHIALDT